MVGIAAMVAIGACSSSSGDNGSKRVHDPALEPGSRSVTFDVHGDARTALVVVPTRRSNHARPLVFVFHGHGGSGADIRKTLDVDRYWPDAVVVYPDGLPGYAGATDPNGTAPGWQSELGEAGDRDLAFFDVMLARVRAGIDIDADRIYLAGHSNGSQLVSLLLNQRGKEIAATANISLLPSRALISTDPVRSMYVSLGERDPIVRYAWMAPLLPVLEQHLGVDRSTAATSGYLTTMRAPRNIELVTYIPPGGHPPPPGTDARVVRFFRRHTLRDG